MIEVLAPGALTTVQDMGRFGHAALGVARCGAADLFSLQAANLLVGNPAHAAALEVTLAGPTLRFHRASRVALCGAEVDARCDDTALPGGRWVDLPAGSELNIGGCRTGARTMLAIAGGIRIAPVLGSRSTDLRAGFGGVEGRALRRGDRLPLAECTPASPDSLRISARWFDPSPTLQRRPREPDEAWTLRCLTGADSLAAGHALDDSPWKVDTRLNRQGVRLTGTAIETLDARDRVSQPVTPGTIQLPPDGQPIILGVDAQTVGGYPCVAHVIRADWPRLAQLRAGDALRFEFVSEQQAEQLDREQQHVLARLALVIDRDPAAWGLAD